MVSHAGALHADMKCRLWYDIWVISSILGGLAGRPLKRTASDLVLSWLLLACFLMLLTHIYFDSIWALYENKYAKCFLFSIEPFAFMCSYFSQFARSEMSNTIVIYDLVVTVQLIPMNYHSVMRSGTREPKSRLRRGDWDEVTKVFIETQGGVGVQVRGSSGGLLETRCGGWGLSERVWDRVSRSGGESKGIVEWGIQDRVARWDCREGPVRVGRTVAERTTASGKENRIWIVTSS